LTTPCACWGRPSGAAEDHVHIILTGVNGRTVDLEISGAAAIAEPLYVVHGDRGALTSDGEEIRLRYLDPARRLRPCRADPATPPDGAGFGNPETLHWIDKTLPVAPRDKVSLEGIWDELFDAVRKGRKFRVTLDEALEVMRVIDAARKGTKFKMRTKN